MSPPVYVPVKKEKNASETKFGFSILHPYSQSTMHSSTTGLRRMMPKIEPSGGNCTGREGDVVPMLLSTSNLVKHQAAVRSKQYCATSGNVCNLPKKIPRPHLLFELCTSEIEEEYREEVESCRLAFLFVGIRDG